MVQMNLDGFAPSLQAQRQGFPVFATTHQHDGQTQTQQGQPPGVIGLKALELAQLALMPQAQKAEQHLVVVGKARHIGVFQHISGVLVVIRMRNAQAHFVQISGPAQLALQLLYLGRIG